jgi:hypothetical protein
MDMLQLSQALPAGTLLGTEGALLQAALRRTSGAWFRARAEEVQRSNEVVTSWADASGAVVARPNTPNTGNSRFDPNPPAALICETGVHCGFTLPEVMARVENFTVAVIYSSPEGEARTLFSIVSGQSSNMIFLSEVADTLIAKDRGEAVSLELPLAGQPRRARMAILSFTGRALLLAAGGQMRQAAGKVAGLDQPADIFIGCRSNRSGLAKTLGKSRLHDVIFWPDRALLGSDHPDDAAALKALQLYHRWTF